MLRKFIGKRNIFLSIFYFLFKQVLFGFKKVKELKKGKKISIKYGLLVPTTLLLT